MYQKRNAIQYPPDGRVPRGESDPEQRSKPVPDHMPIQRIFNDKVLDINRPWYWH
ncbi:MAG: hypothetical protein HOP00_09600 [Nitrospira sp.]|nr:hypothetical protein [Nitrospira sp.]